jgi:hypothetical protein
MPTTSADVAEHEHYEPSFLNCDVCRTEIPVPLQDESPETLGSHAALNIQIYQLQNLEISQILDCGLKK